MPKITRNKSIETDIKIEALNSTLAKINAEKDYIAMMTDVELPEEENNE